MWHMACYPRSVGRYMTAASSKLITARYLKTSQFSDLTIITKDKELKVHKVVVCAHSEYFARMLSGEWKVFYIGLWMQEIAC